MATTPPIVIASAPYAVPVQPVTRNIAQVAISVAIVMPLTGFDDVPINPQMRHDTVTNRNPKTRTSSAATRFENKPVCAPGMGLNVRSAHIIARIATEPIRTNFIGRSRSCRLVVGATPSRSARTSLSPEVSAATIVGMVRMSVISPQAATAPPPLGRLYEIHHSSDLI